MSQQILLIHSQIQMIENRSAMMSISSPPRHPSVRAMVLVTPVNCLVLDFCGHRKSCIILFEYVIQTDAPPHALHHIHRISRIREF